MSNGAILLDELMIDILSRLPAKSLCRFKCVSKSWFALISSPHFAKTHLNRSNNNKCEKVLLSSDSLDSLYSIDCTETSINDDVIATKLDFPKIEHPDLLNYILASCNGLVLVSDEDYTKFLLNPSTGESKKLPNFLFVVDSSPLCCMYGIGYDSAADNYKVVAVSYYAKNSDNDDDYDYDYDDDDIDDCDDDYDYGGDDDDYIDNCDDDYDYGENESHLSFPKTVKPIVLIHLRTQDFPYNNSPLMPHSAVFVNGSIHWLTFKCSDKSLVIAAFDVSEEKFRDILAPSSFEECNISSDLGVLGGCLCKLVCDSDSQADLWVMKEYGVTESWTKFTISLPTYNVEPLCLLPDREVLLEMDGDKLVAYNAKEKRLRYIMVHGMPTTFDAVMSYVESIVSPYYHWIERKFKKGENSRGSSTIQAT
ncbi:F-box/kelch-repeat protein At3g06240-like [Cornus florida]|uniref:F-box/kelch-repeat protein At3g06240-like n=1 Tax=Cornus florida TaxID=4283 RepID=UPI0028971F6F|nr:F-box/kelch-repeat protein At3g06240-like [Cornus florida]